MSSSNGADSSHEDPWSLRTPQWASANLDVRQEAAPASRNVPDGASEGINDQRAVSERCANRTKKTTLTELSSEPEERKAVKMALRKAIRTVRAALHQVDRPWNAKTLAHMRELFGGDVTRDDVRAKMKERLTHALNAMLKTWNNKGGNIYLDDSTSPTAYTAYAPRVKSRHTGQIVMSRYVIRNHPDRLINTLIHEHIHLGCDLRDKWYVKRDENGAFYRKPKTCSTHPLAPLRAEYALDNTDSISHAAVVLAGNKNDGLGNESARAG
ncbi:MAG TPA: hypothetical protein VL997_04495 [Dyella sp.]|nr:hypothetical protein [Dyella sp.]